MENIDSNPKVNMPSTPQEALESLYRGQARKLALTEDVSLFDAILASFFEKAAKLIRKLRKSVEA